ncbi:MAG: hypothetical protein AB3N13_15960 [Arenibacterium sp.]
MTVSNENALKRDGFLHPEDHPSRLGIAGLIVRKLIMCLFDRRQFWPQFTDRQARDAGIDPSDLALRRVELPSRSWRHPKL